MARPRTGTITTIKIPRPRPPLFRTGMLALHRAYLPSRRGRRRPMAMWGPSRAHPRAARARRCPARLHRRSIVTRPQPRHRTRTTVQPLRCEQAAVADTTGGGTRDRLGINLGMLACLFLFSFRCMPLPLPVSAAKQISVFILILMIRGRSVIDTRNADIAGTSRTWT